MATDDLNIEDGIKCLRCLDSGEYFDGEKMKKCKCTKVVDKKEEEGMISVDDTNRKPDKK